MRDDNGSGDINDDVDDDCSGNEGDKDRDEEDGVGYYCSSFKYYCYCPHYCDDNQRNDDDNVDYYTITTILTMSVTQNP